MHYEGNLTITEANAAEYVNLTSVGGELEVLAEFTAPSLTSVGGKLWVNAEFSAPNLTSVGRGLWVRAEFTAPNLTSVGGGLRVNAEFNAPILTSVGGKLGVNAEFSAPNLTSVGGYLEVQSEFTAPNLTHIDGEDTNSFSYLLGLHWSVLITDNYIRIGCQRHTKARWAEFTDNQIKVMDSEALVFWTEHKERILGLTSH